ncbi:MAG: metallophosphoesterase [Desulfuromonadaceae bacterium]|nr:metallophosphoesterase [Desulfuromonadaceae bacterium]
MQRRLTVLTLSSLIGVALCLLTACGDSSSRDKVIDEFNTESDGRNLIVVISDIHLGADLSYAEINENLPALENFLKRIRASRNVKELVIAGDLLDEWFVPAPVDTYAGKDQADFVDRIVTANAGVIGALNHIIQDGTILVTYTPGNHDLTIEVENIARILPGINQARDKEEAAFGLGTYSPADYPTIAIEHGHRYNFFCAPDQFSNQDVAPGTILPPGYFFTRIGAQHAVQKCSESDNEVPMVTQNAAGGDSQDALYLYYKLWRFVLDEMFPIENTFVEKLIVTNVNGFTATYSVNDLLPFQAEAGGLIDVDLYAGVQDTWQQRCELNNVPVPIPVTRAIPGAAINALTDSMADTQYFKNPISDKKLVIFGHTHKAKIVASQNLAGEKTLYANSGTWIDYKESLKNEITMHFLIITPQADDAASETKVVLYNFVNEVVTKMDEDSVRL